MPDLVYVGDPMCSWCWGMAPELRMLREFCQQKDLGFIIKVGGLRPVAVYMDDELKGYLRRHWQQVNAITKQPFNYNLLDRNNFYYHTEPACRLVVAARKWLKDLELEWFEAIQSLFYTQARDLTDTANIEILCQKFNLKFAGFYAYFESPAVKQQTLNEFQQTRDWGINAYPTLVYRNSGQLTGVARGYRPFEEIRSILQRLLTQKSSS